MSATVGRAADVQGKELHDAMRGNDNSKWYKTGRVVVQISSNSMQHDREL